VGNQSISDILQQAALTGSDTSQVNVEQYATIMNIGFALANSGVNEITGAAGGILTAGDNQTQNDLAMDLFAMLLPALLQNFAGTSGQGVIGTGDATAIGNRSETYVHQLADAAASGDGIASIVQDVLVANVGAAGANTGGNTLGGRYASLDPDMAKAVVTLAAFLSQMLALVHTQSASQALAMQQAGLEIPFGDIVLQVQGQMQGVDTELTGETGQRANIRQITIILSLGIAQSNSGLNTAIGVDQQNALATSVNATDFARTGDAFAANDGLVIICQRRNANDVACLAPPVDEPPVDTPVEPVDEPTTSTTAVSTDEGVAPGTTLVEAASSMNGSQEPPSKPQGFTSPSPTHSSTLPSTGSNVADVMLYAGAALLLGLGMLLLATRRRGQPGDDWKLYEKS
jgi:LPXTG-motif cell wall-anchored protein